MLNIVSLPALPPVPFRVYGLGPSFSGPRWLVIWNDPGDLYSVSLGHGPKVRGEFVTVETVSKRPRRPDGRGGGTGPIGLGHAAFTALLDLRDHVGTEEEEESAAGQGVADKWLEREANLLEEDPVSGTANLSSWDLIELVVDQHPQQARVRRAGSAWAFVVDLGDCMITGWGPPGTDVADHPLTHVTDLRAYGIEQAADPA